MLCQKCGGETKVWDTRYDKNENEVFRRRICKSCSYEFFTIEYGVASDAKFIRLWKALARRYSKNGEVGEKVNE